MKYMVTVNNKKYEVEVMDNSQKENLENETKNTNEIKEPLKAPMPGTIIDIKVNIGDSVKRGDTLFILEAMKMESEIASPWDGIIKEIQVIKGASVDTNDILAVFE
ncbi:biotin/lipoyl-containing protein [Clostridium cochlearium]|uniref:biotin/lipoyl-containing protein n=1 Tax=Clostridium cochlearium TaxID=1494 RepID=UPI00156DA5CD|nr:biotin/lipoyl-containing protein [Clostridium cochlearium]MCG4580521.1 acetyl-CoA carboxylase biotin carboxyl carrier protein subunit [Clostridium cochlearium]NSJ90823.1 acetyl-CoA carboxylase biotin carboxyl carrier protein subunit [Coprococcus sp. MSK.21.13]